MNHTERIAPLAAIVSALLSLLCCLPWAIPAAIGMAGASVFFVAAQPWLLAIALVLLVAGLVQLYRKRACGTKSRLSAWLLAVSAVIVLAAILFPQLLADLLAG